MTIRDLVKYKISIDFDFNWNLFVFEYNSTRYNILLNKKDENIVDFGKYHSYVTDKFLLKLIYNEKTHLENILK